MTRSWLISVSQIIKLFVLAPSASFDIKWCRCNCVFKWTQSVDSYDSLGSSRSEDKKYEILSTKSSCSFSIIRFHWMAVSDRFIENLPAQIWRSKMLFLYLYVRFLCSFHSKLWLWLHYIRFFFSFASHFFTIFTTFLFHHLGVLDHLLSQKTALIDEMKMN